MKTVRDAGHRVDATPTSSSTLRDVKPRAGGAGVRCEARFAIEPYTSGKWPLQEKRLRLVIGEVALLDEQLGPASRERAAQLLVALGLDEESAAHLRRALAELAGS